MAGQRRGAGIELIGVGRDHFGSSRANDGGVVTAHAQVTERECAARRHRHVRRALDRQSVDLLNPQAGDVAQRTGGSTKMSPGRHVGDA